MTGEMLYSGEREKEERPWGGWGNHTIGGSWAEEGRIASAINQCSRQREGIDAREGKKLEEKYLLGKQT